MAGFTIRLEGQVEVICAREQRPVPSSAQPLTVALVASGRSGIERTQLLRLLWPDVAPNRCRRRLNTALWRLRELVGTDAQGIVSSSNWLGLDLTQVRIDVEDLLSVAAARPDERLSLPTKTLLRAAETEIEQFAAGCAHPFVAELRDDLRRAHTDACADLSQRAFDDEQHDVAVFWARRVLVEDPYREDLHRLVIRCLHRLGRSSEADRQFTSCRDLLRRDLGIEPQPATIAAASGHVQPGQTRATGADSRDRLRAALEDAIRSCEKAAVAGRAVLAMIDATATRDAAVTES